MLALKHIAAAIVGLGIASVVVIDTADARRGGGGGGGIRAGGGGGGRVGNIGGGGRVANVGGGARRAHVSNPIAGRRDFGRPGRPDFGRPGRPDAGLPGRPGHRPGWGGGNWGNYWPGYGWGAAAVGTGLAYGAYNNYCDPNDPYYASYGNCRTNRGYSAYGYAPGYSAYGYAPGYAGGYWGRRWWR
jgi:hypothetical protein